VKTKFFWAALVASVMAVLAIGDLHAQQRPAAAPVTGGSAVVDISYIFKYHARFKTMMDGMKKEVEAAEGSFKKERDRIAAKSEQLKNFKPGSPDFKKLEEDLTREGADFQLKVSLKKKEFMEREAKIYYTVYQEVNDEVKYYADRNGISLVLRFNGDPVDVNNRESVMREINKPIVYQHGIDITPNILDTLNQRAAGGGTATRPKSATAPSQK
jgi:Skp family chaperone for outer membrane proteins